MGGVGGGRGGNSLVIWGELGTPKMCVFGKHQKTPNNVFLKFHKNRKFYDFVIFNIFNF
jgi:hypothetical protein